MNNQKKKKEEIVKSEILSACSFIKDVVEDKDYNLVEPDRDYLMSARSILKAIANDKKMVKHLAVNYANLF